MIAAARNTDPPAGDDGRQAGLTQLGASTARRE